MKKQLQSYKKGSYSSDFIRMNILSPLFRDVKKLSIGLHKAINLYIQKELSLRDLSVPDFYTIKETSLNPDVSFACSLIELSDDYFLECKKLVNYDNSQPLYIQKQEIIDLIKCKTEIIQLMRSS